jgi:hypothetical protein
MWVYQKKLQYPVNIRKPDLRMAKALLAQYGGPDSELAAGIRYLNQRYSMPNDVCKAILTDIGTEEWVPRYCKPAQKTDSPHAKALLNTTVALRISVPCDREGAEGDRKSPGGPVIASRSEAIQLFSLLRGAEAPRNDGITAVRSCTPAIGFIPIRLCLPLLTKGLTGCA